MDRSLGRRVVTDALRERGAMVEIHDDHFPQTTPDPVWIREVSRKGWVILSRDEAIVRREQERAAVTEAKARIFVPGPRRGTGSDWAASFALGIPGMLRYLRRFDGPFVVRVFAPDRRGKIATHVLRGLGGTPGRN